MGLAACRPGVTTASIADAVRGALLKLGASPAFEGYRPSGAPAPFPGPACVSVNEEALHAPPGERVLAPGDLVTVDVGAELDGWFGDVAESRCLEGANEQARRLLRASRRAVAAAVLAAQPGARWSAVARGVRASLAAEGLMALAGYCGHGIGRALHEPPRAGYDARPATRADFLLLPGMVLTVEPVVGAPPGAVACAPDGWTIRIADGSPACHVERVVAITRRGPRILGLAGRRLRASSGL